MKIKTKPLLEALTSLHRIVKSRNLPIAMGVRIHAQNGTLHLAATNFDEYQIEQLECEGDLADCCPDLAQFLYAIGGEHCELTLAAHILTIKFDGSVLNLKTLPALEFPTRPSDAMLNVGASCTDLATGIQAVAWAAASRDYDRPILESVHITGTSKLLHCEATTGRELAVWEMMLITAKFEAVVPQEIAANLCRALLREESTLAVNNKTIRVTHKTGAFYCKQLEGTHPDVSTFINCERTEVGTAKVSEMADCFSRCDLFTEPQKTPITILTMGMAGGLVEFLGKNAGLSLKFSGTFRPHNFKLNVGSFKKCLSAIEDETVKIFAGPKRVILEAGNLSIVTTEVEELTGKK